MQPMMQASRPEIPEGVEAADVEEEDWEETLVMVRPTARRTAFVTKIFVVISLLYSICERGPETSDWEGGRMSATAGLGVYIAEGNEK